MDYPTKTMAEYAVNLDKSSLTPSSVKATTRHLLDAVACALGAMGGRPARVARGIAETAASTFGASVLGSERQTTPEYAAFANTVMVRYLDFNDTGIGGHPSDMIPAVLALAEPTRASGLDVIKAIHAEYEIVAGLRRGGMMLRNRHVDQVQAVLGGVIGAGLMLDLDEIEMSNAIALAITPNIPMRVVRTGELSDWKGCATAHCAMMAVMAARWARAGLTGPSKPFEGVAGFYDFLGIAPFDLSELGMPQDGRSAVESTGLKFYPAEYSAQGPLGNVLALREKFRINDIKRLTISLHWGGWHEIGGGQGDREEKWHPTTRESADHSLPYLVAVALVDGVITPDSFNDSRLCDPGLKLLMQRIDVVECPEMTRRHAGYIPLWPSAVEVELKNGRRIRRDSGPPKGHPFNPLSDAELEAKFQRLSEPVMPEPQARKLLDTLWSLPDLADINELTKQFRSIVPPLSTC